MAEQGQQGGGEAEAAHRIARNFLIAAIGHRIGGPDHAAGHGRSIAGQIARVEAGPARLGDQQHRAAHAHHRADHMAQMQPLARQQGREQHDQQRPEIVQQIGFQRRSQPQGQEIEEVIAEQPGDA